MKNVKILLVMVGIGFYSVFGFAGGPSVSTDLFKEAPTSISSVKFKAFSQTAFNVSPYSAYVVRSMNTKLIITLTPGWSYQVRSVQYTLLFKLGGSSIEVFKGQVTIPAGDLSQTNLPANFTAEVPLSVSVSPGKYVAVLKTSDSTGSQEYSFSVEVGDALPSNQKPPVWMLYEDLCQPEGSALKPEGCPDGRADMATHCCKLPAFLILANPVSQPVQNMSKAMEALGDRTCIIFNNLSERSRRVSPGWCSMEFPKFMGVLGQLPDIAWEYPFVGFKDGRKNLLWLCCNSLAVEE